MKAKELKEVTINVHSDEMFIMPYGEFCKEQAENEGMRYDVEEVDGEWKASGYHTNSYHDESFEQIFSTEEEAELYCQELASNFLNQNPNYISATYYNAKEAARDIENYADVEFFTNYELSEDCTTEELEAWIAAKMKEEGMEPIQRVF
jgi:hypothetical protein